MVDYLLEVDDEEELGASSVDRAYLEGRPQLAQDLVADCKTEADAVWVELVVVVADLSEHLEELGDVLLLDAHAGVFDLKLQLHHLEVLLLR